MTPWYGESGCNRSASNQNAVVHLICFQINNNSNTTLVTDAGDQTCVHVNKLRVWYVLLRVRYSTPADCSLLLNFCKSTDRQIQMFKLGKCSTGTLEQLDLMTGYHRHTPS